MATINDEVWIELGISCCDLRAILLNSYFLVQHKKGKTKAKVFNYENLMISLNGRLDANISRFYPLTVHNIKHYIITELFYNHTRYKFDYLHPEPINFIEINEKLNYIKDTVELYKYDIEIDRKLILKVLKNLKNKIKKNELRYNMLM